LSFCSAGKEYGFSLIAFELVEHPNKNQYSYIMSAEQYKHLNNKLLVHNVL
jgi:hypothetical protein